MRVAVCLSGMVRTLAKTCPSIKQCLIEPYNADVFIHTYDKMGIRDLPVSPGWLSSLLRPKALKIESYDEWTLTFKKERDRLYCIPGPVWPLNMAPEGRWKLAGALSQIWHIHACDLLRREQEEKEGFEYDIVVRARMDTPFCAVPAPLGEPIFQPLPVDTVFTPSHAAYLGLCDQFAMGSGKAMRIYSDYYLHFEEVYRSRVLLLHYGMQEKLLKRYVTKFSTIKAVPFHFPFEIQRDNELQIQSHKTQEFTEKYIHTGLAS